MKRRSGKRTATREVKLEVKMEDGIGTSAGRSRRLRATAVRAGRRGPSPSSSDRPSSPYPPEQTHRWSQMPRGRSDSSSILVWTEPRRRTVIVLESSTNTSSHRTYNGPSDEHNPGALSEQSPQRAASAAGSHGDATGAEGQILAVGGIRNAGDIEMEVLKLVV
uniref:Uncharacterized protein n=1 Tax=Oryza brachyantha TaxID=4533 RepID=J3M7B4_ORYBR